jgi:hypothetical protein
VIINSPRIKSSRIKSFRRQIIPRHQIAHDLRAAETTRRNKKAAQTARLFFK